MKTMFSRSLLALSVALVAGQACADASADTAADNAAQVQQQLDKLSKQVKELQAQLDAVASAQQPISPKLAAFEKVSLWGYGEIYYLHPTRHSDQTVADLARAVFGIGYQFDDNTRFNSEYEIEHGVTSSSDPGEFEVEQFYVDHRVNQSVSVQGGLFLIPAGYTNESHEPTNFYGVQRNFVETLIIPSTWREGGIALHGDTENGIRWNVGITTGPNLANWELNPESPSYQTALQLINDGPAPLRATHQELALANAKHLSQYVAVNYSGVPGFNVGGSLFSGIAGRVGNSPADQRVTLWEGHTRWTPGNLELQAVYAHGSISKTEDVNLLNPGVSNPVPASFYGYYAQAAYKVWESGKSHLSPFVRAEHYNMADTVKGLAPGFGTVPTGPALLGDGSLGFWPTQADTVYTAGANYYVTSNVVVKADYQNFRTNKDFNRFDLGLGLAF